LKFKQYFPKALGDDTKPKANSKKTILKTAKSSLESKNGLLPCQCNPFWFWLPDHQILFMLSAV
jgi:hypothetical protein